MLPFLLCVVLYLYGLRFFVCAVRGRVLDHSPTDGGAHGVAVSQCCVCWQLRPIVSTRPPDPVMDDGTMDSLEARIKRALGAVQEARQRTVSPFDAPSTSTGAKVCVRVSVRVQRSQCSSGSTRPHV